MRHCINASVGAESFTKKLILIKSSLIQLFINMSFLFLYEYIR